MLRQIIINCKKVKVKEKNIFKIEKQHTEEIDDSNYCKLQKQWDPRSRTCLVLKNCQPRILYLIKKSIRNESRKFSAKKNKEKARLF